jgi:serine/threonine protein kinase
VTPGRLDPEAWRRVNDVFHRARALASQERVAFVQRECADSAAIRDDVLSLLAADDRTDRFLAEPAVHPASVAAMHLVGQRVGQYRIDRILGVGGMGVVYQAEDLRLGRSVALKAISSDVTRDPARRERLRREARAAAALTHPGIATVYALEEFDSDLFIAGEFVAGDTLREEIARGPADAVLVLDTAVELAQALAAAHDHGVIHRDLKPENVIRTPAGRVKILDFGLARMRDLPPELANLTEDGTLFGTPGYMSPEQIRHESLDGRSDLFSLGILLYELLTGAHPFGGADSAAMIAGILEKEPLPFRSSTDARPGSGSFKLGLEGVIRTLIRKSRTSRFASAHQLLTALERLRAGDRSVAELPDRTVPGDALWWWKFHQAATSVFYLLLLIPTWLARQYLGNSPGLPLFLVAVVAVVAATTLRMHLWFAASAMPDEWAHQRASSWIWLRAADLLLVASVVASGFAVLDDHPAIAVVLVTCGVIALLGAAVIEPATTRAAFERKPRTRSAD